MVIYCCKSVPANTCRMLVHSLLFLLLFLLILLHFLLLLPLAVSSPASSSPDRIFGVPSNADYKPPGFMLILRIGPRKERARRHTMFFFRLLAILATPIFVSHERIVGLSRDSDKSSSHERIQDEYRLIP